MAAPSKPVPAVTYGPTGDSYNDVTAAWQDQQRILGSMPSTQVPVAQFVPASGILALTAASIKLSPTDNPDPELTAFDSISRIDLATLADGMTVSLELTTPGISVTIVHLVGGGAQSGEIDLAGDVNVTLSDKAHRLVLQRRGTRVVEVGREGYAGAGGGGFTFNEDVDFQGAAAFNLSRRFRVAPETTAVIVLGDRDSVVHVLGGTVALPTSPLGWRVEDSFQLLQRGPAMLLTPAINLVSAQNHDRGFGPNARVTCIARELSNPMKWEILGYTKAPEAGAPVPPPSEISRTFIASPFNALTVSTDAASIAYKEVARATHTPEPNSRWCYIGQGSFNGSGNSTANKALCRIRGLDLTDGPKSMAGRYVQHRESAGVLSYRTYGPAPEPITYIQEIKAGTTAHTASMAQPGVFGIQLEPDEHGYLNTLLTSTVAPHTTAVDAGSYTGTFIADDYVILAYCEWTNTGGGEGGILSLSIDGTEYGAYERAKEFNAGTQGAWGMVKPVSLTAGSHTVKVRMRAPTGVTTAIESTRSTLIILKRGRFQDWRAADNPNPTVSSVTTMASAAAVTGAFLNGWDYLFLTGASLSLAQETAAAASRMEQRLGAEVRSSQVRSSPLQNNDYHSNTGVVATTFRGDGTSKTASLDHSTNNTAVAATIADAAILVLSLKRVA